MIAVDDKVMNAWYDLLNGNISVPVYVEDSAPENAENYVELRCESESEDDTKHSFRSDLVIITDIVTKFKESPNRSVASGIDNEIKALIKSDGTRAGVHNLAAQSGIQILSVVPGDASFLPEYHDGVIYYRKIVRYTHRIIQN